jgi:hypothetical protein
MRYLLTALGVIGLGVGFLMLANAHDADKISKSTTVLQVAGIFFAVGAATIDIVEAIKGHRQSTH